MCLARVNPVGGHAMWEELTSGFVTRAGDTAAELHTRAMENATEW